MNKIIRTILFQIAKSIPGLVKEINRQADLKFLREVVCYNQGKLANYSFIASEKHKAIKNRYIKLNDQSNRSREDEQELKKECEEFENFLDEEFRKLSKKNFEFFLDGICSKKIGGKYPRICIKAVRENQIITLVRDRYPCFEDENYLVQENTAFNTIKETGKYYICNDIPEASEKGNYTNARIYRDSVSNHYRQKNWLLNWQYRLSNKEDKNWQSCWRKVKTPQGQEVSPPMETCYKSTLVVPMTLYNSEEFLSEKFRKHFRLEAQSSRKTSFGFLCLDHQISNYFNKDEDLDLCYVLADILSLYLIQRLTFTTYSNTYQNCRTLIEDSEDKLK